MAEFLGGKKASAPIIPSSEEDGDVESAYSHDALAEKMRKQREDMIANDIARQIRQIDDNIRRIDETIKQLERDRNPSPMLGALRSGREENVRKKVQLTNGSQLQDAVAETDVTVMRKEVQQRHARGEATDEELISTGDKDFGRKRNEAQFHNTYMYEELFTDQENGDTILTFPDEVVEQLGLKEGDNLAISAVNGSLVIKKI
jgi:hypothetical protein